ncbi:MAG: ornithine carbamoyltransferase [Pseudomonadota bacterium]
MTPRHFISLDQVHPDDLQLILNLAAGFEGSTTLQPLTGKMIVFFTQAPTTRTRLSFAAAATRLGAQIVSFAESESQISRGESLIDSARVIAGYADAIVMRWRDHAALCAFANASHVPVINGLTPEGHPTQLMADIKTLIDHWADVRGQSVAFVGDGSCNMVSSWIHAAVAFGFELHIASPPAYQPVPEVLAWAKSKGHEIIVSDDPSKACTGARAIVTDTWVSIGDQDVDARRRALAPFQVNEALMARAAKDAIFLHCLPAHRGEEVTDDVIDSPASVVWQEAKNRIYVNCGILVYALCDSPHEILAQL